MLRFLILLLGVVMFGLFGKANAKAPSYQDGQVWVLKSGDFKGTEVLIVKVEDHPLQKEVVHITVLGPISNQEGKTTPEISHLPFSLKALKKSKMKKVRQLETLSDSWREGYQYWNAEALEGKAGVFSVTVSEAIDFIFDQISVENTSTETKLMDPNDIVFSDYVHESFSEAFLARIKFTTDTFEAIDGISYEQAIDLYKRDLNPEENIVIWEEMARVFVSFCQDNCDAMDKKKEIYKALLLASMFPKDEVVTHLEPKILTVSEINQLTSLYKLEPMPLPVIRD